MKRSLAGFFLTASAILAFACCFNSPQTSQADSDPDPGEAVIGAPETPAKNPAGPLSRPKENPTPTPSPTPSPTPTPEPPPTPTPTPTPTATPTACDVYEIGLHEITLNRAETKDLLCLHYSTLESGMRYCDTYQWRDAKLNQPLDDIRIVRGAAADLACIKQLLAHHRRQDNTMKMRWLSEDYGALNAGQNTALSDSDDFIGKYFNKFRVPTQIQFGTAYRGFGERKINDVFKEQRLETVYMDKDCEPASKPGPDVLKCLSDVSWAESPVSLLWDGARKMDNDYTFTRFPLDPRIGSSKWYLWKASATAPLLVYDPGHTGKIGSSAQLFGNWTFGGKEQAPGLQPASWRKDRPSATPWENGFEALGALDNNGDGRISGEELEPLALWFDSNRDGIADEGELVSVINKGVLALYFQPDRVDAQTGDIYVSAGFDRLVKGKVVRGSSVDWYTDSFDTSSSALSHLYDRSPGKHASAKKSSQASDVIPGDSRTSAINGQSFTGQWLWSLNSSAGKESSWGVLALKENGVDVVGYSYLESPFNENNTLGLKSKISRASVVGKKALNAKDEVVLEFAVTNADGETIAKTTAQLVDGGKKLWGQTTTTLGARNVSYEWVADRQESGK